MDMFDPNNWDSDELFDTRTNMNSRVLDLRDKLESRDVVIWRLLKQRKQLLISHAVMALVVIVIFIYFSYR